MTSPIHWFAAYCVPRHEKRIAQHCSARQIEHFLPTYRTRRQWKDGSSPVLELPLFPNYMFVRIDYAARSRVLDIPGVIALVGHGKGAAPVPDEDVALLRESIAQQKAEPHEYPPFGTRVRVKVGPLTGMEGVLTKAKNGTSRVIFTIDTINQSVAVEVDIHELERVDGFSFSSTQFGGAHTQFQPVS